MKFRIIRGRQQEYEETETSERFWSCSELLHVLVPDQYAGIGDAILELASQRGVYLHRFLFYALAATKGLCAVPALPTQFTGYARAILRFIEEKRPVPILLEESSVNRKWGVAGTPDAKLLLGKTVIGLDLKTGEPMLTHAPQIECYRTFAEYRDCQAWHVLYIREDGTYRLPKIDRSARHQAALMNAVNILNWRRVV